MAYKNGGFVEYSDSEIKQMLGRAGRPQFDDSGTAVIMTTNDMKQRYEAFVTGAKDRLESSLHETLHEHINSEICLGTINHVNRAKEWLKSTFLYIRMRSNPQRYDPEFKEGYDWEKRLEGLFLNFDPSKKRYLSGKSHAVQLTNATSSGICMNDIGNLVISEMVTMNNDILRPTSKKEPVVV
ncbi:5230_t:CDS:2 [Acaulospora colombiana]|uniref:5230_t:CDS:1 n=1 Tax=Acaulospora colombiana TaxID=27376 RepID=A0ACA9K3W5_9GLOM|nr:5230_t:CDS:2 [Acaulospora colombiana]